MILLKDISTVDNGARFHSVDLHIHSYGVSHDVRDSSMTPQAIVDSAVRQGLSVIAITDHNSVANVESAIAHARDGGMTTNGTKTYANEMRTLMFNGLRDWL